MIRFWLTFSIIACITSSCCRSTNEVWDDTKSASRHVRRGIYALGGKQGDVRQVRSRDEFMPCDTTMWARSKELDFIPAPMEDNTLEIAMNESPFSPGEPGSGIPGIEAFSDSSKDPRFSRVFRTIYFPYDSNYLQGDDQLKALKTAATYLKQHPDTYIFVAGHCDQRGSESYNLSLGSRRAGTVRNYLIKEGVDDSQIFVISYGKERPFSLGNNEEAWTKNRRVEFKVYEQHHDNTTHFGKRSIPNAGNLSASW